MSAEPDVTNAEEPLPLEFLVEPPAAAPARPRELATGQWPHLARPARALPGDGTQHRNAPRPDGDTTEQSDKEE